MGKYSTCEEGPWCDKSHSSDEEDYDYESYPLLPLPPPMIPLECRPLALLPYTAESLESSVKMSVCSDDSDATLVPGSETPTGPPTPPPSTTQHRLFDENGPGGELRLLPWANLAAGSDANVVQIGGGHPVHVVAIESLVPNGRSLITTGSSVVQEASLTPATEVVVSETAKQMLRDWKKEFGTRPSRETGVNTAGNAQGMSSTNVKNRTNANTARGDEQVKDKQSAKGSDTNINNAKGTETDTNTQDTNTESSSTEGAEETQHNTTPVEADSHPSNAAAAATTNTPEGPAPPSTPPSHLRHALSVPTLPAMHHISDPTLVEHYRSERRADPLAFDAATRALKQSMVDAKLSRGGRGRLLRTEYSVELASREDATVAERWANATRVEMRSRGNTLTRRGGSGEGDGEGNRRAEIARMLSRIRTSTDDDDNDGVQTTDTAEIATTRDDNVDAENNDKNNTNTNTGANGKGKGKGKESGHATSDGSGDGAGTDATNATDATDATAGPSGTTAAAGITPPANTTTLDPTFDLAAHHARASAALVDRLAAMPGHMTRVTTTGNVRTQQSMQRTMTDDVEKRVVKTYIEITEVIEVLREGKVKVKDILATVDKDDAKKAQKMRKQKTKTKAKTKSDQGGCKGTNDNGENDQGDQDDQDGGNSQGVGGVETLSGWRVVKM